MLQYIADLVPEKASRRRRARSRATTCMELLAFISTEIHKQFSPLFLPETPAPMQERQRGKIGERLLYLAGPARRSARS